MTRMNGKEDPHDESVLVVGAGIGGIKAAIDSAEKGLNVLLIDESPYIGGTLAKLDRQFPTNDCGMCKMLPYFGGEFCVDICLRRGLSHPNIDIITSVELIALEGESGDFTATIRKKKCLIDPEKCIACNLCVDVCPVEVKDEFNEKHGLRKAVYIQFPSAVPKMYTIDTQACTKCGECVKVCPTDAVNLEAEEENLILPVGAVILSSGFSPYDPDEMGALHYREYQNIFTALEFERLLSGTGSKGKRDIKDISGEDGPRRIAFLQCIGSRDEKREYCSFACCMHSLKEAMMAKEMDPKIDITIFYMDMRTFGKGYYRYYTKAKEMGIRFQRARVADIVQEPDKNLRVNFAREDDEPQHDIFDIVVLATGQDPPRNFMELAKALNINLDEYGFCRTALGRGVETERDGLFICGSFSGPKDIPDTIAEAAAAAAQAASILIGESGEGEVRDHVTELAEQIMAAKKAHTEEREGMGILLCRCGSIIPDSLNTKEILEHSKGLPGVTFTEEIDFLCLKLDEVRNKLKETGVDRVIFAACSPYPFESKFQRTLAMAGVNPALLGIVNLREECAWVHEDKVMATEKAKALISMAHNRLMNKEPAAAASRKVVPRALVVGGGISGITAALRIAESGYEVDIVEKTDVLGGNARNVRHTIDGLDILKLLDDRIGKIEKEKGITVYLDSEITHVGGRVGDFLVGIKTPSEELKKQYGTVIIATGGSSKTTDEYLFGQHESVITQWDLEDLIAQGKLGKKSIAMIQCVNLRNEENPYCGRVCCQNAVKDAIKVKELNPDSDVFILYRDIMTYGKYENYYIKAKEMGVSFIRFDLDNKPEVKSTEGKLHISVRDPVLGSEILLSPDLLVLSLGPKPGENRELLDKFDTNLDMDEDGFISEANVKFRPVDILVDGIWVCGLAHSPRNLIECMIHGESAAGGALSVLTRERIIPRETVSFVSERWCTGCEMCVTACPYIARVMDSEKKVAKVLEPECRGCGVCAVVCPSSAAKLRGYRDEQIMDMLDEAVS